MVVLCGQESELTLGLFRTTSVNHALNQSWLFTTASFHKNLEDTKELEVEVWVPPHASATAAHAPAGCNCSTQLDPSRTHLDLSHRTMASLLKNSVGSREKMTVD